MMFEWLHRPLPVPDPGVAEMARRRQHQLTKPPGSLGRLETLAIRLAALRGEISPELGPVRIAVFAADHGVNAHGVSAYPSSVTAAMVGNFAGGGAAINVLSRQLDASLEVVDVGTLEPLPALPGVVDRRQGPGTADFTTAPAMTDGQLAGALGAGSEALERAGAVGLFIGGEMGIGNTTAAAALACALLGAPADDLAGPGTGLDAQGFARKIAILERALARHSEHLSHPHETLRRLGGFEIAALAGSYIACAQMGVPVLVDGFISSAAALAAERLRPGVTEWLILTHASAEPGHQRIVEALGGHPLLDLGMRLGEGSGAAVTVPLLRMACALHNQMATFAEAAVSEQLSP